MFPYQEIHFNDYLFSNDPSLLDIPAIHQYLSGESYWVRGITLDAVERSTRHSACFGIYHNGQQVGFARLITDYVSFGYLADVYVLQEHRGKGLSKKLMEFILSFIDRETFRSIFLGTRDAHGLYSRYGFKVVEDTGRFMKLTLKQYPEVS